MIPRWPLVTSVLPGGEENYIIICIKLFLRPDVEKKSVAISLPCSTQRKMACWGPPHPFPYTSFKNIYHNQTMMLPVQPGATLAHMLLVYQSIPPRPGWCLLCLLVHPGSKSGTVLVRKPQVKTICNHTKSIYEYYSCSAVSTIATLGYSL